MSDTGLLMRDEAVLVVIDVQDKLLRNTLDWEETLERIKTCIKVAKIFGLPLLFTEQYPAGLGPTNGSLKELVEEWAPIEKVWFSALGSPFADKLEETGRKQIALCGIETHVCILQTCHEALQQDYSVWLIEDACSSRSERDHDSAVNSMEKAGAEIGCTERFLFEVARKAGTDEFKEAQKLIK